MLDDEVTMTQAPRARIRALRDAHHGAAVAVLADAFRSYPTTQWIVAPSALASDVAITKLVGFFVMARGLRDEPVLGLFDRGALAGVALVADPDGPTSPPELARQREALWIELGEEARARYEAYGEASATVSADRSRARLHLNLLGVASGFQRRGVGSDLLRYVIDLAAERKRRLTATTEDPANLGFYARHGFEVTGEVRLSGKLTIWGLRTGR